jgi:predicted PurR-regulated permease PerM
MKPTRDWLTRKGVSRTIAAFGVYVTTLVLIVGFAVLALPMVFEQFSLIVAKLGGPVDGRWRAGRAFPFLARSPPLGSRRWSPSRRAPDCSCSPSRSPRRPRSDPLSGA